MKIQACAVLFASTLILAGCDQMQGLNVTDNTTKGISADAVPESKVLATVNGTAITQDIYDIYVLQRKHKPGGADANNNSVVLNEIINFELMRQEGVNKGLDKNAETIALLDHQQRSIMAGVAIKLFLSDNPISDEQLQQFYHQQVGKGGTDYKAKHILLKSEEDATQVITLLENGSDFEELAREKSTGPSGPSGGNLGWFSQGQMVKPFSDAAAALEKGSYTKVPVQTRFGWHVILLEDARESTPPPFADLKDRLRIAMVNKVLQEHVQKIREAATVEIMAVEELAEELPESPSDTTEPAPDADAEITASTTDETAPAEKSPEELPGSPSDTTEPVPDAGAETTASTTDETAPVEESPEETTEPVSDDAM